MAGDELVFQPRGGENFVDPNAQGTFLTVFFRADDVRKNWTGKGLTIEVVYEFENCDVIANNLSTSNIEGRRQIFFRRIFSIRRDPR